MSTALTHETPPPRPARPPGTGTWVFLGVYSAIFPPVCWISGKLIAQPDQAWQVIVEAAVKQILALPFLQSLAFSFAIATIGDWMAFRRYPGHDKVVSSLIVFSLMLAAIGFWAAAPALLDVDSGLLSTKGFAVAGLQVILTLCAIFVCADIRSNLSH
jgi:hypothetical protein